MSVADWTGIASAGAAWLALILAAVSLYNNHRSNKRQDELAETTEQLNRLLIERETQEGQENKRADVSANLVEIAKSNRRLRVFNRGRGTARNVRITDLVDGRSILDKEEIARKFPVPILEQHQSVDVLARSFIGSPSRAHIRLHWDDDTGNDHEKELTPSL